MLDLFQENLKALSKQYSQKYIAEKTNFSQSSINNYLSKSSEPSIKFLVALKDAFGINVDDFLFSEFKLEVQVPYDKYEGNYIIYYYNNDSYKGEVHVNLKNTLNYGVLSIFKEREFDKEVIVLATFMKDRENAIRILKSCNMAKTSKELAKIYSQTGNIYKGNVDISEQSIFFELKNKENSDQSYIILNNPPTKSNYIGGVGTVNSISRGREHNPCIQFIILSKKLLDVPDGKLYDCLKFDDYDVNLNDSIKDVIDLFKRLYAEKNEISVELTDNQKQAIVRNKLEYHLSEILEANAFRFTKISNKDDDAIYKLIKEGIDV